MTCWPSRCKPRPKAYQHIPTSSYDECGSKYTNPPFGWWFTNGWWMWIQMEPSFGSQMAWPQLAKRLQRATKRPSACLSCIRPGRWLGPAWHPKIHELHESFRILISRMDTYGWLIQKIVETTSKEDLGSMSPFLGGKQLRFLTIQILFKLWFLDFPSICPTNQQTRKALLKSEFLGHAMLLYWFWLSSARIIHNVYQAPTNRTVTYHYYNSWILMDFTLLSSSIFPGLLCTNLDDQTSYKT